MFTSNLSSLWYKRSSTFIQKKKGRRFNLLKSKKNITQEKRTKKQSKEMTKSSFIMINNIVLWRE